MRDSKDLPIVIRTPDQRLRVFVSSTLRELAEERQAVRGAIVDLRLAPVMFESGARPHPPQRLYRSYLEQSHVFVGIYFTSYGWVAPGMQISGLEDEFNLSSGKPRLIYIKEPAPDRELPLAHLLERIRDEGSESYRSFATPEELSELVGNDLVLLLTEHFETARGEGPEEKGPQAPLPRNLPVPRNPLIDREKELETARRMLLSDDVALVTLTGPAGTGKSRLGIQIAIELTPHFSDGVYLVALEAIRDPDLVIPAIARTLGVSEGSDGEPPDVALRRHLCDRQVLLLLDNFEQVLAAGPHLASLLESCVGVKLLVTSRAPLRLRPERELPVSPLDVPPRTQPMRQPLTHYSAVRLFIDRACGVKPEFEVTNDNAPAVAEICYRLDGLPLAIELAAARIRMLSPQALLSRLEDRFALLRGGTRDLPERQQTLLSAVAWSYNLLGPDEQALLRQMSVFAGGWTHEAAEAVCRFETVRPYDVFDGLEKLADNNLIRQADEPQGEPRLGMLETIHEFASKRLDETGEAPAARERHASYFLDLAERAAGEMYRPLEAWHRRLGADLDNLRAAIAWSIDNARHEWALRIALALYPYWGPHACWREAVHWLDKGLAGEGSVSDAVRALAMVRSGRLMSELGDHVRGIERLRHSVRLYESIADSRGLSLALHNLGIAVRESGDYSQATEILQRALAMRRQTADRNTYATILALAQVEMEHGDLDQATRLFQEGLQQARATGDDERAAWALFNLGEIMVDRGEFSLAESCFAEAAPILESHAGLSLDALVSGGRGHLALMRGDPESAIRLLSAAVRAMHKLGNRKYCLLGIERLAIAASAMHRPERAARLAGAADRLRQSLRVPRAPAHHIELARCLEDLHAQLAEEGFNQARAAGGEMTLDQAVAYAIGEAGTS